MASPAQNPDIDDSDGRWKWLYIFGAVAAFLSFLYIPTQIITFMTIPEPTTAIGWFELFQRSKFQGLMSFEFMFVVNAVVGVALTLALYVTLREKYEPFMTLALIFGLLGAIAIIIARPAIELMHLADHYTAAASEEQRIIFVTAGETLLALRHGTAFHVGYLLGSLNLIIIPLVMLRTEIFNKTTAYIGLISGILGFGLYFPGMGVFLAILSVVFMGIWDILVSIRLFQLGRGVV